MDKIELIKKAIEKAERFESKLTPEAFNVPFLGSLKIRALLNNLGELATHYCDIGCHKAGSASSAVFLNDNIKFVTAIDSWASDVDNDEDKAYPQFLDNMNKSLPKSTKMNVLIGDCFSVNLKKIKPKVDMYSFDAGHSFEEQRDALIYYKPILADEFIYCCDDWQFGEVKAGTLEGLRVGGYDILFEQELLNTTPGDGHLNDEWWRGYYVALLKKK